MTIQSARRKKVEKVIATAASLLDTPYRYGVYAEPKKKGAPKNVDCSSFIQYIFECAGIALPRSSILQAAEGRTIGDKKNMRPGDLLFFEGDKGHYFHSLFKKKIYIGHVALYCGAGMIIHARQSAGGVAIEPLDVFEKNKYCEVVRVQRVI